jgi:hypothetical protein
LYYSPLVAVSPLWPFLFFPARRMWRHGPELGTANNSWSCALFINVVLIHGTMDLSYRPRKFSHTTFFHWLNGWTTSCDLFWLLTWDGKSLSAGDFPSVSRVQGQGQIWAQLVTELTQE